MNANSAPNIAEIRVHNKYSDFWQNLHRCRNFSLYSSEKYERVYEYCLIACRYLRPDFWFYFSALLCICRKLFYQVYGDIYEDSSNHLDITKIISFGYCVLKNLYIFLERRHRFWSTSLAPYNSSGTQHSTDKTFTAAPLHLHITESGTSVAGDHWQQHSSSCKLLTAASLQLQLSDINLSEKVSLSAITCLSVLNAGAVVCDRADYYRMVYTCAHWG